MPNPSLKNEHKYHSSGEGEEADTARRRETEDDSEKLDLGDVLEDMTYFSKRTPEGQSFNTREDPYKGLSDAEKIAKAIELAEQEEYSGSKQKRAAKTGRKKVGKHRKKSRTIYVSGSRDAERSGRKESVRKNVPARAGRPVHRRRSGRLLQEQRKKILILAAIIACIAAFLGIWFAVGHYTYRSYAIVKQEKRNDNVSTCENADGDILRYSSEGAALLDTDFNSLWNESFTMSRPKADVCGERILIYDQLGTSVYLFDKKGKVSTFDAPSPILKAAVSGTDTVAMLLQNGNSTEFVYCDSDGSVIAEGQSNLSETGYPADLAVSPNGENLVISYFRIRGSNISTTLNFYNFGDAGQGKKNNLIGSDHLSGTIVPEVYFLTDKKMIAIRDDGFSVYEGTASISEVKRVEFQDDIVSTFHDGSQIAFCFSGGSDQSGYRLDVYSGNGKLISSADMSSSYENAEVCDGQILFYDPSELNIYNANGHLRFSGKIAEGNIGSVLKVGRNRYFIATDQTMEIVKLRS